METRTNSDIGVVKSLASIVLLRAVVALLAVAGWIVTAISYLYLFGEQVFEKAILGDSIPPGVGAMTLPYVGALLAGFCLTVPGSLEREGRLIRDCLTPIAPGYLPRAARRAALVLLLAALVAASLVACGEGAGEPTQSVQTPATAPANTPTPASTDAPASTVTASPTTALGGESPFPGIASDSPLPTLDSGSLSGDRDALVAIYNATDGVNWDDNTNWLSDAPLDEWYGVRTNTDGRVRALFLRSNRLSGEIPAELRTLSSLELLDLGYNQLSGEIPPDLGSLSILQLLWLFGNELSGEIPPELGSLSRLQELRLSSNGLSGEIPPELGSLSNLTQLSLGSNRLTGEIPRELGNLSKLESLGLFDNQLSGCIPDELRETRYNDFSPLGLPFCK